MRTFEAFYGSFAQQPVLLWLAAAIGLGVATRRGLAPSARRFCLLFSLVPFADAWLTADDVAGIGALGPTAALVSGSLFAIVGDLRVFLFLEGATPEGEVALGTGDILRSLAWSLVVPVAAALVHGALPQTASRARATFLVYEIAFLALLAIRTRVAPTPARAWARPVVLFVNVYYGLWALSDALILGLGLDLGFLIRTAANVAYYGGLLAVVSLSAPRR
jgi:hypothetical protein